jgi:integrase/recombinase XerD
MQVAVYTENNLQIAETRIASLVEDFILSLDVSPASRKQYKRTLKQYFNWIIENSYDLSEISRADLIRYKEDLLSSGKSSLTVGSYITSLRRFYEWTEANKYYPNVAKGIKTPKRKQQFKKQPLSISQATELLCYFENRSLRDFAIVNLLLRTGLRTIEVIRANIEDIVFKGSQRVLLVHGKGRDEKDNFVVLTDKTYEPIREYLATRSTTPEAPLFVSVSNNSAGDRLTTRTISAIAKEALEGIGLTDKAYSAHSLRHTTAVNILRAGGSLETAQYTLRHTNPATTQIYTETLKEERRLANSGESLIDGMF